MLRGWGWPLVLALGCGDPASTPAAPDSDDGSGTSSTGDTAALDTGGLATDGTQDGTAAANTSSDDGLDTGSTTSEPEPLQPDPGASRYALVGETVVLDGSGSSGAVQYQWSLGDGREPMPPGDDPVLQVVYDEPGRYRPVLTVFDGEGNSLADDVTITVTLEPTHIPRHSSSIEAGPDDAVAVVSPDSDELTTVVRQGDRFALGARTTTCQRPRSVSWIDSQRVVVACQRDVVAIHDLGAGTSTSVAFDYGARPFGVIALDGIAYVTLQGSGEVARVDLESATIIETTPVIADARGLALVPDGRLAVSRWRSEDAEAEVMLLDPKSGATERVTLQFDPQPASDTEAGGVPSYLGSVVVSPVGNLAAIPSLQANIGQGEFVNGEALTFETTLRGVVSFLELDNAAVGENFDLRKHFDNRGFMSAAVFNSRGDYLFAAARGARAVERIDTFTVGQAGALLDVGFAPQGLALSADDRYLFVDAFMSRAVVVYDVTDFSVLPQPVATIAVTDGEPLAAEVALGKRLFNDAFDPRLSKDSYMACAHCHLDGEADLRTWDFTDRGEGVRNTISLLGRSGDAHGPIHWSANFDEVHDFEGDIRGPFGGVGLMSDEDFETGTQAEPLGAPKAGIAADLDALAAYVSSLDTYPRSPHRLSDGTLSDEALVGQVLFESVALGCTTCHSGPRLTDSVFVTPGDPLLHDVGTLTTASGQRLGGPLVGIDTPTLHGLWNTAPYLHDGSSATVLEILEAPGDLHGTTSGLTPTQRQQIAAYLLSLDG